MPTTLTVGLFWLEINPPGPVHKKLTPGVVELPTRVTVGFTQVFTPPLAEIFGVVIFCKTVAPAVPVQPFWVLVTVTRYGPGTVTIGFC